MKRIIAVLAVVAVAVVLLSGCSIVASPVAGGLYTNVDWAGSATSNAVSTKSGSGSCTSILGLLAIGDCSINTIARDAKITKIHHVDNSSFSCLALFGKYTVTVYGE